MEHLFWDFVAYAQEQKLGIEGIAIADEKKVLLEHHFVPDQARNIYSHTKSFMATAVGIAIAEDKLSLEDRLTEYFPEAVPKDAQPELHEITLRNLLTMSSGFNRSYLMGSDRRSGKGVPDYVAYMLSRPMEMKPGERFHYSTADSILAGRMVEKAVGMGLGEYLYRRLFSHMDIGYPVWENCPQGHPIGGGGMFLKLTDMMKLGQLYLADGIWNGERLVESEWIREASSKQISTPGEEEEQYIWSCGYGYQFWLSPYPGSYRADGAFGQITTVLPESGLVVSVQCPETGDFDQVKKAMHTMLLAQL